MARHDKMKLGMSMRGLGYHPAAWRHPDMPADGTLRFEHYARNTITAERGLFDMIFFADGIGLRERDEPRGSLARSGYELVEMEPMTLLPALAVVLEHPAALLPRPNGGGVRASGAGVAAARPFPFPYRV
jgi:hypothetical protein